MTKKTSIALLAVAITVVGAIGFVALNNGNDIEPMVKNEMDILKEEPMEAEDTMKADTAVKTEEMKEKTPMAAPTVPEMMNNGSPAPEFTLMDVQGTSHSLGDYKGQKVYVKFWASWCSICLAGLEDIDQLAGEDNGFKVITIVSPGMSGEQNTADFTQWFKGLETKNMTVLLDEGGVMARAYGVRAYPTSGYIGSDGILVKALPGHVDNDRIKDAFMGIN